jgi:hypothetical protein
MRWNKPAIVIIFCFLLLTCGLEEHFYLPQISQGRVERTSNTIAVIDIPSLDTVQFRYASHYSIFYKIYISEYQESGSVYETVDLRSRVNPTLNSDYLAIYPMTDPTNTTSSPNVNLFTSRNYFELELSGTDIKRILSTDGGLLTITFPTLTGDFPVLRLRGGSDYILKRSGNLISPEPDMFFRNSPELRDNANAVDNVNRDVARLVSGTPQFTYASMYIVAVGANPETFGPIYSRPTFINVFLLPDAN